MGTALCWLRQHTPAGSSGVDSLPAVLGPRKIVVQKGTVGREGCLAAARQRRARRAQRAVAGLGGGRGAVLQEGGKGAAAAVAQL